MPKLRNGGTDIEKFAQWIGRKCRNHNPLKELEFAPAAREKMARTYKTDHKGDVKIVAEGQRNVLLYAAANRVFEITVREVEPEQYEGVETVAVGF